MKVLIDEKISSPFFTVWIFIQEYLINLKEFNPEISWFYLFENSNQKRMAVLLKESRKFKRRFSKKDDGEEVGEEFVTFSMNK